MSETLSAFCFYGTSAIFLIALVLLVPLYFAPPKSAARTRALKHIAWSLWTIGALGVTYLVADFEYETQLSDNPVHDTHFWLRYLWDVALQSAPFFVPPGFYWFRVLTMKG